MGARTTARGGTGIWYKRSLLLEVSSVTLPACPECLLTQRCLRHQADDEIVLHLDDGPRPNDIVWHLMDDEPVLSVLDDRGQPMSEREIRRVIADETERAVRSAVRAVARLRRTDDDRARRRGDPSRG